jgi:hypothetical protein
MHCTANANFKDYIKSKVAIVAENYEFILKSEYSEEVLDDNDYVSFFFSFNCSFELNLLFVSYPR